MEGTMGQPLNPDEEPHIETPVIDIQDLEYKATPETRVSNKGVKIEPTIDDMDVRDIAREDEAAIEALEEFERQLKQQPPG
jgi:hypothetical protein